MAPTMIYAINLQQQKPFSTLQLSSLDLHNPFGPHQVVIIIMTHYQTKEK
jgi:hypothetical protein